MTTQFPATCSQSHPALLLHDDNELQTHIVSEHPGIPPQDIKKALISSTSTVGPSINAPTITNAYARWGITRASVSSIRADDISDPMEITMTSYLSYLASFGQVQQPPVDPDVGAFAIEFFAYVLNTTASEDASKAGSFKLRDKSTGSHAVVKWSTLFSDATAFYQRDLTLFTPRKLMRVFEDLFWEMWMDREVKALDRIRAFGTKKSRQFLLPSGRHPNAYVVVPQLFDDHLTAEERSCRMLHMSTVEKVAAGSERSTFTGFDQQGLHLAREAQKSQITRANAGLGSTTRGPDFGQSTLDLLYGKGAAMLSGGKKP